MVVECEEGGGSYCIHILHQETERNEYGPQPTSFSFPVLLQPETPTREIL